MKPGNVGNHGLRPACYGDTPGIPREYFEQIDGGRIDCWGDFDSSLCGGDSRRPIFANCRALEHAS